MINAKRQAEAMTDDELVEALRSEIDVRLEREPYYGIKGSHVTLTYLAAEYLRRQLVERTA